MAARTEASIGFGPVARNSANGHANGRTNGQANGQSNGKTNGHTAACGPGSIQDCCADGILESSASLARRIANDPQPAEPRNFEEFIYKVWGAGIAKHFAIPYNKKLWAVPLAEMETSWLGGRVPLPDLGEMIEGYFRDGSRWRDISRAEFRAARRSNRPGCWWKPAIAAAVPELFRQATARRAQSGNSRPAQPRHAPARG